MVSQSSKKKRPAYDVSLKLKVDGYAEIHGNRAASREFTVPETNVRDWRRMKVHIFNQKVGVRVIHECVLYTNKYG